MKIFKKIATLKNVVICLPLLSLFVGFFWPWMGSEPCDFCGIKHVTGSDVFYAIGNSLMPAVSYLCLYLLAREYKPMRMHRAYMFTMVLLVGVYWWFLIKDVLFYGFHICIFEPGNALVFRIEALIFILLICYVYVNKKRINDAPR